VLTLRLHPSYVATLAQEKKNMATKSPASSSTVENLLDTAASVGGVHTVDLTLRSEPRSRTKLPRSLVNYIQALFKNPDAHHGVVEARIRGLNAESGHVELIDMLKAQIVDKVRVARAGSSSANPTDDAVYEAIEAAYERKKQSLVLATGLTFSSGGRDDPRDSVA
ncbi:MAG: hypothetical protein ACLQUY_03070, partial [Ktedonobacterales bacterium]